MKESNQLSMREAIALHWRAFRDLRRSTPHVFEVTALRAIITSVSPYVMVWLSAQLINELSGAQREERLWELTAAALLSAAAFSLAGGALEHWVNALKAQFGFGKDTLFFEKWLQLDYADVDAAEARGLYSQIMENAIWGNRGFDQVYDCFENLLRGVIGMISGIALTVGLFTQRVPDGPFAFLNSPGFLFLIIVALFAVTLIRPVCSSREREYWNHGDDEARFANRLFSEFGFFGAQPKWLLDIRIYSQEKLAEYYMDVMQAKDFFGVNGFLAHKARGAMGAWSAAGGGSGAILTAAVYLFVGLKAWAGAFGVGSVTQYVGAVTALSGSLATLLTCVTQLRSESYFLRPVYEFLDIPNKMYQGSLTTEKRSDRRYEIEFRDVSFQYPDSEIWALRHVNMKFQVGQRLAVVGENGSGKTTFIKLLCRLYDPQEGQILLNGIDIRKYNYRDYMDVFSVVFQDFQLLSQPLGSNVAGAVNYDKNRVNRALADAGFSDRLDTLPQGLDAMLYKDFAEEGVLVSGGEAQKIAIARALYKDAPFIILDEPTAALDPIAEAEIYSKFNEIVGDKTAIYISHRLSSCKFCDEIVVFDHGAVIQQGSHDSLVADQGGKYYELWHAQAQYYD